MPPIAECVTKGCDGRVWIAQTHNIAKCAKCRCNEAINKDRRDGYVYEDLGKTISREDMLKEAKRLIEYRRAYSLKRISAMTKQRLYRFIITERKATAKYRRNHKL